MTPSLLTRAALGLALISTPLILSACDITAAQDAFENVKVVLGVEAQKTTAGVSFVDAATGQPLSADFLVSLTGPDAVTVVDSYGDPLDKRTAKGGVVTFGIHNAKAPTANAPVVVRLDASPTGYLPVSQSLVLSDTGSVMLQVRVLRPSAPSRGTQTGQQSNTTTSAGTTAPISATTSAAAPPSGGTAAPQATVSAPVGTTLRDANNQALTGAVTTTLTSVDPTQAASVSLLPAGLSTAIFGKNAATASVVVASGNLLVYVGETPAATVSNGTLRFNIPASVTTNPATGQPWAAGQTTLAYRFHIPAGGTGTWVQDGSFTVVDAPGGGFALETTRPSLSTGWWAGVVHVQTTVDVTATVNRNGQTGTLEVTLSQPGVSRTLTLSGTQSTATFADVPTLSNGGVRTIGVVYGAGQVASASTTGTSATVSLGAPSPAITLTVTPKCATPDRGLYFATLPSIFIQVSESGQNSYFSLGDVTKAAVVTRQGGTAAGKILKATFSTNLMQVGKTYDLIGVYEGNTFGPETRTVMSSVTDITWEVDDDYCQ